MDASNFDTRYLALVDRLRSHPDKALINTLTQVAETEEKKPGYPYTRVVELLSQRLATVRSRNHQHTKTVH